MSGGAAVAEDQEREHLLELLRLLQVQRAEFEVEHQHLRVRFGAHNVPRLLEAVDRRIAAHEADHGALDRGIEAEVIENVEVEPRRVEAGAGRDQHMRDAARSSSLSLSLSSARCASRERTARRSPCASRYRGSCRACRTRAR
jgi:hypothetical protein